uniref:DNA replication licensing factor MCM3 n=1 Tax=Glossina austeni TaxID=7395 RepID=A0A1A9UNX1_GLOAU
MVDAEQYIKDIQREFVDFLDDEEDQGIYAGHVKDMIGEKSRRLIVNINDLKRKNSQRALGLLTNASDELLAFGRALKEYVSTVDPTYAKGYEDFFVGFEGCFGNRHLTPRSLTSTYLGNLVCVEGIVTKVSLIRPKVVRSVHYCPVTRKVIERKYTDLTSFEAVPSSAVYPTKDEDGNLLETEFGLSVYKDHQSLTIQEMPEKAPAGQLPRSVDIICDDDLVDRCKPGDRVQIVGNHRCLPGKQGGYASGIFRTVLIANNISLLSKDSNLDISREDIVLCKKLAKNADIFELLSKSLAPSIHGNAHVKRAILCLLLGGVEKILTNGTRLRGDINILLIGDPSVAKSQMLRYVLNTAPRAIPTTGRGSSGVGLTAAVTTDQETGERRLEAGAMVLADRGVVCIDEFDKMSDIDRTAIHEVMEQGRVTISKAGIHASLNARCSVFAAANPVYGRYDPYKTPMENIGLQDSLLSRFDLLFVMRDVIDNDIDQLISDHVVRMHRYRNPKEADGEPLSMGSSYADSLSFASSTDNKKDTEIYEKYDSLLHGKSRKRHEKILSVEFMRKYIHIAKCMKPKLSEQACEVISNEYSRLRSQEDEQPQVARTQPITARTLETLIRLATAHARARMSKTVTADDAQAAIELVQFAYFKKVLEKEKASKRRRASNANSSGEEPENGSDTRRASPLHRSKRTRVGRTEDSTSVVDDESDHEIETPQPDAGDLTRRDTRQASTARKLTTNSSDIQTEPETGSTEMSTEPVPVSITDNRLGSFKNSLQRLFREAREQSLNLQRITAAVNENNPEPFTKEEIQAAIHRMTEDNQIMMADEIVFLI